MAAVSALRLLVHVALGVGLLSGCGFLNGSSESPGPTAPETESTSTTRVSEPPPSSEPIAEEVSCPSGDFTEKVEPPDWLGLVVEACTTKSGSSLLVKNISPGLISLTPDALTALGSVQPAQSNDLRPAVDLMLAKRLPVGTPRMKNVPTGGYVIADARIQGGIARVNVSIPFQNAVADYISGKVVGYVEAKLTPRSRQQAEAVATCAAEVTSLWTDSQPPPSGSNLDGLLAQAILGPAFSCGQLFQSVAAEMKAPPPAAPGLAAEFGVIPYLKASVWDDFLKLAKNGARLVLH